MKIILMTKANASGQEADHLLTSILTDASVETVFFEPKQFPPPERDWHCDWLISYLCPWVLPADVLEQADNNMNFHPGPPEYPGTGCYNFALYENAKTYGVTCHHMDPRVDSGDIYAVRRFDIPPGSTVDALQRASHAVMLDLFEEMLRRIRNGGAFERCAEWTKLATTSRDMEALRIVPLDSSAEEVERRVRAFAHSKFEGACIELHGYKFFADARDLLDTEK